MGRINSIDADGVLRSAVTVVGDLAYTSGFSGKGTGNVTTDTEEAMEQVQMALQSAGSQMDRKTVYCQVDVADLSDMPAIDRIYRSYFKKLPARQVIQVVAPGPLASAKVSIMCIAS